MRSPSDGDLSVTMQTVMQTVMSNALSTFCNAVLGHLLKIKSLLKLQACADSDCSKQSQVR